MSEQPTDPPQKGRIILPGQEHDDAPRKEPEATTTPGTSRIILPPGVEAEEAGEIPEYPKLRPLIILPFKEGERELLVVSDPMGVIPGQPVLAIEALGLLQLFDGNTSVADITTALMRENKDIRMGNMVKDFVRQMDEMLMLDSPRYHKALQALRDEYHPLEIRQALFAGRSYPVEPDQLKVNLDAHFAAAREDAAGGADDSPARAVMAPHLDPRRAGATIARAIDRLDDGTQDPFRVVVFGTGHSLFEDTFALTRKHFETPLGKVECDTKFVDTVANGLGDVAYRGELAHREEHSIEFMALYLKHRFGDRVKIVPVLLSGFHDLVARGLTPQDDPATEKLIEAIRDTAAKSEGRTVHLASVDFSHVGPRFGDPSVDDRIRDEVKAKDIAAIQAAEKGDPDAWFNAIAEHKDSTRICGFGPTYAMLRVAAPGPGRLLKYDRSDEDDSSFVTVAAMVWP